MFRPDTEAKRGAECGAGVGEGEDVPPRERGQVPGTIPETFPLSIPETIVGGGGVGARVWGLRFGSSMVVLEFQGEDVPPRERGQVSGTIPETRNPEFETRIPESET